MTQQSYDSACSDTPQQIVTGSTNTMSTSSTNVFGKRPIVTPTSNRTLKKKSNKCSKVKGNFFLNCQIPTVLFYQAVKTVKCKANSISFPINTMQCNKAVDATSSKNSVSDTSKFQSFTIPL